MLIEFIKKRNLKKLNEPNKIIELNSRPLRAADDNRDHHEEFAGWLLNVTAYYATGQKVIVITISNFSKDERAIHGTAPFVFVVFRG